jgi:hypothetical protein
VVLAVVPVAVPVGDLSPVHGLVVALAQAGEQLGVEGVLPGGDRILDRTAGFFEDLADVAGPALPVRVQGVDAVEVAEDVLAALLHPGELGVELGPAVVVVADQVPGIAVQDAQAFDRLAGPRGRGGVPDQPLAGGADGDHLRAARQHRAVLAGVADDIDRGLVGAQCLLGAQRGLHRRVEPGRLQSCGEPFVRAGDEPGRDRRPQQRGHQHRGPLRRHVALAAQQDRRRVDVRPVDHRPGLPVRRVRGGDRPAAPAAQPRQQPVHLLQPHRRDIPDLTPAPARRLRAGQARPARAALRRRTRLLGPVRVPLRLQARAPMARLPAGLAPL